jgi:hypothetical protein
VVLDVERAADAHGLLCPPPSVSREGAVAAAIGARLRRDGLAVRLLPPGELTAQSLHRAQTLILAVPGDPAAAVAEVVRRCADRRFRRTPLRRILAHRGDRAPDLPESPEAAPVRLEPLAQEAQGARALLAAHPRTLISTPGAAWSRTSWLRGARRQPWPGWSMPCT